MGSRIAAHFANAGYPVELLDIVVPGQQSRDHAARTGIENASKQRPVAFFTDAARALVTPGNLEDHLDRLRGCDWIVEAVSENLEIKRRLHWQVAAVRATNAIVSTNTSGIPLASITEGFPAEFREHFLGTHFFNPPRYLHLVEVIPGADTTPEILAWVTNFCDRHLGKGVVLCKDTPNFVANRIGSYFGATLHQLTAAGSYSVEEVDALTGPLIGLPKSASFRLVDIIGLDVWVHVLRNLKSLVPHDPGIERYNVPAFMERMMELGWLGEKRGQGFYKRVGKGADKEIHALDFATFEYRPAEKVRFESVEAARGISNLSARLRSLVASADRAGAFLWPLFRDLFTYSAAMVPEISDRIVEIDWAMRWGYGFKLGPFELWDALGVPETVERMRSEGSAVPECVERMLASDATSFYQFADHDGKPGIKYFDLTGTAFHELEPRPGVTVLSDIKRARGTLSPSARKPANSEASLIDLGDGVLCLEFHNKLNAITSGLVDWMEAALEETDARYDALVIANEGEHFCAGANLQALLTAAQGGKWDDIDRLVRSFQQVMMAMKYSPKPVVVAPFGLAVGGGCEIVLHGARVQASAETYMGLVETSVGLVPAGGGCKELLIRTGSAKSAFELIGYAKTSGSAAHARELGLLRSADGLTMNPERLVADAKAAALAMLAEYAPGAPLTHIPVEGEAGIAALKITLFMAREAGYLSEYDAAIGEKLAHILSGGRLSGSQTVCEQYLLDLEREVFLSLCGERLTQERMAHMLKYGKPLRN